MTSGPLEEKEVEEGRVSSMGRYPPLPDFRLPSPRIEIELKFVFGLVLVTTANFSKKANFDAGFVI